MNTKGGMNLAGEHKTWNDIVHVSTKDGTNLISLNRKDRMKGSRDHRSWNETSVVNSKDGMKLLW
jgi:hypothetical protein